MTDNESYSPWDDFIVYATDSDTAWPLREILVKAFYYVNMSNERGEKVYALYDNLSFSRKDTDYPLQVARAISYVTDKPVYARLHVINYEVAVDSVKEIETIPEPVPQRTRTSIMPGPIRSKWASSCVSL